MSFPSNGVNSLISPMTAYNIAMTPLTQAEARVLAVARYLEAEGIKVTLTNVASAAGYANSGSIHHIVKRLDAMNFWPWAKYGAYGRVRVPARVLTHVDQVPDAPTPRRNDHYGNGKANGQAGNGKANGHAGNGNAKKSKPTPQAPNTTQVLGRTVTKLNRILVDCPNPLYWRLKKIISFIEQQVRS